MNIIRHFFVFAVAGAALAVVAAPYSFNIVCDEPERMRRVGEKTEFRIFCTDIGTNTLGGDAEKPQGSKEMMKNLSADGVE